jgi:hypothetical protein
MQYRYIARNGHNVRKNIICPTSVVSMAIRTRSPSKNIEFCILLVLLLVVVVQDLVLVVAGGVLVPNLLLFAIAIETEAKIYFW